MTKDTPLQARLRAAGLKQTELAGFLGVSPNTLYRQIHGVQGMEWPPYAEAFLCAWEIMTPEQRAAWTAKVQDQGGAAENPVRPDPPRG